jgi:hypothetical protein
VAEPRLALVGTYTHAQPARGDAGRVAQGVYLVACAADGRIEVRGVAACDDPSFVVLHPRLPLAYAVNERSGAPGGLTVIALGEGGAGSMCTDCRMVAPRGCAMQAAARIRGGRLRPTRTVCWRSAVSPTSRTST